MPLNFGEAAIILSLKKNRVTSHNLTQETTLNTYFMFFSSFSENNGRLYFDNITVSICEIYRFDYNKHVIIFNNVFIGRYV